MNKPKYRGIAILRPEALAEIGEMPVSELRKLIGDAPRSYQAITSVVKPNGSIREIYSVLPPLKAFQRCIVEKIFHQVEFPPYLQGSIKDDGTPRGYIENAALHAPYRFIVRDDIRSFFPSMRFELVLDIWQDFFRFPYDIARMVTRATTYRGFLPQGASTSSYLANLAFWDVEYRLAATLKKHGFFYSRYVDDINISSDTPLNIEAVAFVRGQVYGMLRSKGFRPNRSKRRVQTRASKKTVHGLNINAGRPTMDRKERSRIRAAVKACEEMAKTDQSSDVYLSLYRRTLGRIENMSRLHGRVAQAYRQRLLVISPR